MATAIVLFIVVLVLLVMLWNAWKENNQNLGTVLEEGKEQIVDVRAQVLADCRGPQANEADCQASLQNLKDVLQEFSSNLDNATGTATTTAQ